MTTMVENVFMIANVIMNTAWLIITWHHRHSLTRDTWTRDLFSSQWDLPVLLGRSAGPPLILHLHLHSGMFVIFYVKFFNLDFEDCQFTFGSTSFWVVLDFWVFSFGFWILLRPHLTIRLFQLCYMVKGFLCHSGFLIELTDKSSWHDMLSQWYPVVILREMTLG